MTAGTALLCGAGSARAGFEMPRQVPSAKLVQQVGLTEISVEYDCPTVKGRKIEVSPAAKLRFSKEVTVGDKVIPPGAYWLLATPGKAAWTLTLNKATAPAAAGDAKPDVEVARFKVQPKASARRERLTFLFSELTDDRAALDLEWDDARISIPVRVNTSEQVLSAIGDLDNAWRSFANAARYMLEVKKDYDAGLKYIDQSLALREDWYSMWVKAALLAGKGRYADANQIAQRAYELERKAGNGTALEPELQLAIAEWKKKGHLPDQPREQDAKRDFEAKRDLKEQKSEEKVAAEEKTAPAFTPASSVVAPSPEAAGLRRTRLRRR
jgi:hypothetical protein